MSETADTNVPPPFPAGEEDETRLFCERVKLYRMAGDSGEWKERGVGELKILRHNVTAKYRVLMRYSPQASSRLLSVYQRQSSLWCLLNCVMTSSCDVLQARTGAEDLRQSPHHWRDDAGAPGDVREDVQLVGQRLLRAGAQAGR